MSGAEVSEAVRQSVREAAGDRCGYCLSPQRLVMGQLEIEHLNPRARGGSNEESNLWLSCSLCNRYKGIQIEAADPLTGVLCRSIIHALIIGANILAGARTAQRSSG